MSFVFRFDPASDQWRSLPFDQAHSLDTLQAAVGGCIDTITRTRITECAFTLDFYGNDEALLVECPVIRYKACDTPFVGPLVVVGATEDGESVGLSSELLPAVRALVVPLTADDLRELLFSAE